jgi:hypothetical protein
VALLSFTDAIVDIGNVFTTFDLNGNQVSPFGRWEFLSYTNIGVACKLNPNAPTSRIPQLD